MKEERQVYSMEQIGNRNRLMNIHGAHIPEPITQLWRPALLPKSSLPTEPDFVKQQDWDKTKASEVLSLSLKFKEGAKKNPQNSPIKNNPLM